MCRSEDYNRTTTKRRDICDFWAWLRKSEDFSEFPKNDSLRRKACPCRLHKIFSYTLAAATPRSLCDLSVGRGRGAASAIPRDPGSDTALRAHLPEGRADMTGCRRRQPNESGRGSALTVADPRTHGLCRHSGLRFCLCSPSVIVYGNTLRLNFPGEWRYIDGLGDRYHRRENVIWEMSDQETW